MSNQLVVKFAEKYSVDQSKVLTTLKNTCFKGQVSDEQMTALMIVADQYGLNPFIKEIYAFPDKNNGIVPVVGVDGWSRIINGNQLLDGIDFEQDDDSCTCRIYRKDRNHPVTVTEYLSECKRPTQPWQSHPKRMLRHKALIQCARLAFGFVGIFDQDEAERLAEVTSNPARQTAATISEKEKQPYTSLQADLLTSLEDKAKEGGSKALEAAWMALNKEDRIAFKDELNRLKKIAADSEITDVEVTQ